MSACMSEFFEYNALYRENLTNCGTMFLSHIYWASLSVEQLQLLERVLY